MERQQQEVVAQSMKLRWQPDCDPFDGASSFGGVMVTIRKASVFGGLIFAVSTPFVLAQGQQSSPTFPEDLLASSTDLVVWSSAQKPKPVPEPLPPPDKGVPQPDPQQPPAPQAPEQNQVQTFTGKIVKAGDSFVLKVSSDKTYQLDSQNGLGTYEDKDVKVVGTLDSGNNTIHVSKIELLT